MIQNMYFFEASTSSQQPLFQKKNFLGAVISWKQSFYLIVLHNQFYNIFIWKDFPLTSIHSSKYTIAWSDFAIPQFLIVENSKQRINFNIGCVTFWELVNNCGIFKQALENSPKEFCITCGSKDVTMRIC